MIVTTCRIEVAWSTEHQVWVADVPDLPCCTALGPTPHQAVEQVELVAAAWLEVAHATGRPPPAPSESALRA